jgi:Fe-S cluster assembly protein SufD
MRIITKNTTILDVCKKSKNTRAYEVRNGAVITCIIVAISENNLDYSMSILLNGAGVRVNVFGIVIGKKSSRINVHTELLHLKPHTTSSVLVKSVLFDASTFIYDGMTRVQPDAQKTDAYQRNENLILGNNARAYTKPSLEILANDVRCKHGATIGSIPPDQLWYMQSRGIGKKIAGRLYISGFMKSLVEKIDDPAIRSRIVKILYRAI